MDPYSDKPQATGESAPPAGYPPQGTGEAPPPSGYPAAAGAVEHEDRGLFGFGHKKPAEGKHGAHDSGHGGAHGAAVSHDKPQHGGHGLFGGGHGHEKPQHGGHEKPQHGLYEEGKQALGKIFHKKDKKKKGWFKK